jgi:hypothetical protein
MRGSWQNRSTELTEPGPRADEVSDPDDRPHAQLGVRNLTGYTAWWQLRSKGAGQVELDLTAQTLIYRSCLLGGSGKPRVVLGAR